ncbi:uncharacterized protein H6S33_002779 [Morchella sextelata]|uniref:uncharacterized protein n=1 Tax=Morchella sextelata TaxID=1174677 RepID=UPI001D04BC46|nr:uncharacterized protein H6S33_002779 [Morchella sextelata]KAH0607745.1 hypothetical protein H6S33_002779 [Morchella sextelata]
MSLAHAPWSFQFLLTLIYLEVPVNIRFQLQETVGPTAVKTPKPTELSHEGEGCSKSVWTCSLMRAIPWGVKAPESNRGIDPGAGSNSQDMTRDGMVELESWWGEQHQQREGLFGISNMKAYQFQDQQGAFTKC